MAHTALEFVKTYAASFATLFGTPHAQPAEAPVAPPADGKHVGVVLLKPARRSGARLVLLPLLPPPVPKVDLPSEIWARCLHFAMDLTRERSTLSPHAYSKLLKSRRNLLLVNKKFRDLASPILYSHIKLHTLSSLEALHHSVMAGEERWDNLRRIPHSTPGRWIQTVDISSLSSDLRPRSSKLKADTCLSDVFRLTPFLTGFTSDPKFVLSGRVMKALGEVSYKLTYLKGLAASEDSLSMPESPWLLERDPLTALVRACAASLEILEIIGTGLAQDEDTVNGIIMQHELQFVPIHMPHLHTLALHGVPSSPIFYTLLHSSLPSLVRLTFTVYPSRHSKEAQSPSAAFLGTHGSTLESLILSTPPDWPPPDYAGTFTVPAQGSPVYLEHSILHLLPKLVRLNLSFPLPPLLLLPVRGSPLRTLLFPRPIPALLPFVLEMSQGSPDGRLPTVDGIGLKKVVWTKSRWLRSDVGLSSRMARTAGDQAEMIRWRRALAKLKVQVIDADGKAV